MRIIIINYEMGNLNSVFNACRHIGKPAIISDRPADLRDAHYVILPGVGSFGMGMKNLSIGWIEALEREVRDKGKPFLGICLGMQLLAEKGSEHGVHNGLGWISGTVEKLESPNHTMRIPHIGWNDVIINPKTIMYRNFDPLLPIFYFVHSYVFAAKDPGVINGHFEYGKTFAASIEFENIFATQYHPEKSQKAGLAVLNNFLNFNG